MQNKGAVRTFAILLALVCLYQLSFTYFTKKAESDAKAYAAGDPAKEYAYLDSLANEPIYNFLFLKEYTYRECKGNEINFGLDLKGGMNLVLEVKVADIVKALSNYNQNEIFLTAVKNAEKKEETSTKDFITLFAEEFEALDPNAQLATIFSTVELKGLVKYDDSNADVVKVLRSETLHTDIYNSRDKQYELAPYTVPEAPAPQPYRPLRRHAAQHPAPRKGRPRACRTAGRDRPAACARPAPGHRKSRVLGDLQQR